MAYLADVRMDVSSVGELVTNQQKIVMKIVPGFWQVQGQVSVRFGTPCKSQAVTFQFSNVWVCGYAAAAGLKLLLRDLMPVLLGSINLFACKISVYLN